MPFDVAMPKLTDSMEEGRIVEWKVAPGDRVREGDVLAEIETDKAVMELESFWDGAVAALLRGNGDVAAVGEVIARIAEAGEGDQTAGGGAEGREAGETGRAAEGRLGEGEAASRGEEAAARPETGAPRPPVEGLGEAPEPRTRAGGEPGAGEEAAGAAGASRVIPLPGAHPLSERGGAESPRPEPPPRESERAEPAAAEGPSQGVVASPRARKLARERGLDLAEVRGTGPEGRITSADVEAAARGGGSKRSAGDERPDEELPPVTFAEGEAEPEEVSFYQKAVIRRVVGSARTVPHFFVSAAVRADELLKRKQEAGPGVTLTHLLLRASALALEAFPEANRSYDRGRWIRWKVVNLGVAVQTGAGLVVAVLRGAQGKDLPWLAEQTRGLVERARAGRLRPDERTNATFTLSNLGPYAVERFTAIPNPPSALTLAAGSVLEEAVVSGGRLEAGRVMHLTLSCDHRVVDGVLAARFLGAVKELLEGPGDL